MTRPGPIAPVALCCALLAGCGAGSSTSKAPQYVAQGNRICATQLAMLDRLPRPTTPEAAVAYLPHVLTIMHAESAQLRPLDPTRASRAELTAALTETERLSALLSRFLKRLHTGVVELTTFGQVQTESNVLRSQIDADFRRAGLTRCVE